MKTLKDLNLKNKSVLLRVDINSNVLNKKLVYNPRIKEAASTIKLLKKLGAKITIIAHQGNKVKPDFISLKAHAKELSKFTKVKFIPDIIGKRAITEIKKLKPSESILLENIRFHPEETTNPKTKNKLIEKLVPHFDYFINDAFSVLHRDHTSITGFPKHLPSVVGPLVEKELNALEKIKIKNCLYILGGSKPESNIKLLKNKNEIIAGGIFAQTCLVALGQNFGYQNEFLKSEALVKTDYKKFLKKLKSKINKKKTTFPTDFAINKNNKRHEIKINDFPSDYEIKDIGKNTIKEFKKKIKSAKAIYMKGPLGYASDKRFAKGTLEILKEIQKSKAPSIIGGGHLGEYMKKYKVDKSKFTHVSLSGGALLNYMAGEKLPGLKALGYYKNKPF